jgi:hypothetical protein
MQTSVIREPDRLGPSYHAFAMKSFPYVESEIDADLEDMIDEAAVLPINKNPYTAKRL